MKTVDVIRPGSLINIIGPSGTLKRIIQNKDYFEHRGYLINVYTHDNINGSLYKPMDNSMNQSYIKNGIKKIKAYLRLKAKSMKLLAFIYLYRDYLNVKRLVNYYISLNKTPDILVFHSTTECYLYHKMKTNENSKVVLFFHSDGIPNKMLYSYYPCIKNSIIAKWLMRIHNEAFLSADKCVFIAKNGQDNFLKIYPDYPTKKTALILNGIEDFSVSEVEELKKVEQKYESFKYRLCSTGTINQRKGQRIIIEALAATKKDKREQIHLALIGEGPERVRLEKLVNDYGLAKNVTFEGLIENSQVYKYLYQNNIYILMSNNEGLPISIIEAMRTGLPVISTKISGIPELVDINGILIDPNVEQLTTIFDHMDEYDWNVMGKRSRERWKKDFTFDRMKKQYCDMLDSLF